MSAAYAAAPLLVLDRSASPRPQAPWPSRAGLALDVAIALYHLERYAGRAVAGVVAYVL